MRLLNRNDELRKVPLLDGTFKTEEVSSQSIAFQCDLIPAILALNNDLVVDLRSVFSILVSTIWTSNFQFEIHMFPER